MATYSRRIPRNHTPPVCFGQDVENSEKLAAEWVSQDVLDYERGVTLQLENKIKELNKAVSGCCVVIVTHPVASQANSKRFSRSWKRCDNRPLTTHYKCWKSSWPTQK